MRLPCHNGVMTGTSKPASKPPLSVLIISDGRPGHFVLSEGIVAALGRLRATDVARLNVKRPVWIPARVLSWLVNWGLGAQSILRFIYGVTPSSLGQPDVIVSAGGNTLAANIAVARLTGAPNIFYGSLRRYKPADFALVMTSYERDANAPNRLMWLKPSRLDPDETILGQNDSHETEDCLGLIIGGNSGTVKYAGDDWDMLVAFLLAFHDITGRRWIISNAPRTPGSVSDRLAQLVNTAGEAVAKFIDVRTAGPGTLGQLLANSSAVLCTADSSTMLSETVWMRKPVIAIEPAAFSLPDNEMNYRAWLEKNGWAKRLAIAELSSGAVSNALSEIKPLDENPLDALATELGRRFPELVG